MIKIKLMILLILILGKSLYPQYWLPLEIGNKWQLLKTKLTGNQFPNVTTSYELLETIINKDTVIDNQRFYKFGTDYYRYSEIDQKIYVWFNNQERVHMDFNKAVGDTFHSGNTVCTVTGSQNVIFSDTLNCKGFKRFSVTQPNNTVVRVEESFAPGVGRYSAYRSSTSFYNFSSTTDYLLMGILNDDEGNIIYLTNNYKTQIDITPVTLINKQLFKLDFAVNHPFNRLAPNNSNAFIFVNTIMMESYYSKNDTIILNNPKSAGLVSYFNYSVSMNIDTVLMKDGFTFNYRIITTDKGIIQETTYSPDSGYYQCVWDFSTNIDDETPGLNEYVLHQNYPNPFNPSTVISYQLPTAGDITLKVYDVLGREVAILVNEYKEAGYYEVEFLPESPIGAGSIKNPASGVYFYQLRAGDYSETKKMILLR